MAFDEELIKGISAIYKYVFENPGVHRNVLRKQLINKGKIASKEKFAKILESLIVLDKIILTGEYLTLNPNMVSIGVFQKSGDGGYIVTPKSNKHLGVSKSVASGYYSGDVVDLIVEHSGKELRVIILGKSKKEFNAEKEQEHVLDKIFDAKEENLILGRVVKVSHDELVFIPNKKSIVPRQIPILNNKEEIAEFQDKLCLMRFENLDSPLLGGTIVSVKGDAGNPIHEYDAIAESYGAIMSWDNPKIKAEIAKIPRFIDVDSLTLISENEAQRSQRGNVTVDLRHLPFVTVDPKTCKDMDDAIYSTINENGDIVCYTAVANVSKYIDLNSEIGKLYTAAAFTLYAPNKAYNILPTLLATGVCSINPNEDKLAFVVKTIIDKNTGKVKSSNIYDALIRSCEKYSYENAQQIVDCLDCEEARSYLTQNAMQGEQLLPEEQILLNYYSAQIIKKGFEQRKMIRFVANKEREIIFNDDLQDVVDINIVPHLFYHEVIESFMITANEATAKYARDNNIDIIYRVHDEPNPRKMARANEFFNILGIEFDGDLSAQGTRTLIDLIRDTANEEVINKFLIKMQSRAVYSDKLYSSKKNENEEDWLGERISHYALQSPHYSHSTSIIRRLPDYVTHYNILADLHGTKPLSLGRIQDIVDIANKRQLEVDQAEKDFEDISSVLYCEKHIGETMSGRISKIRYASPEEGYEDEIVVIVRNEERGISAEIPISQIMGRPAHNCSLSEQGCAVYDERGNIVVALCKPIDFIIEKADRKTMIIRGKTNKELIRQADSRSIDYRHHHKTPELAHAHEKEQRSKRIKSNASHHNYDDDGYGK